MRRFLLLGAFLLAVGASGLAAPECAVACSCVPPGDLASFREDDLVVAVGRTGPRVGNDVPFSVERWFWGAGIAPVVALVPADTRFPDGTTAFNTCGLGLPAGQHVLMVAGRDPVDGRLHPSSCLPFVDLESAEGQALLAEAIATFGDGVSPVVFETADPSTDDSGLDGTLVAAAIIAIALGVVVLIGAGVVLGRRDQSA